MAVTDEVYNKIAPYLTIAIKNPSLYSEGFSSYYYQIKIELSNLNISTCFFQLASNFFSFCFRNTFFDVLWCTINEVFCFFQT